MLAISYVYELPFRKSQHGFTGKMLGGWQLSGTTTVQSGLHVNTSGGTRLSASPCLPATCAPSIGYGGNVDLIGDWRTIPDGYPSNQWINPAAFTGRTDFIGAMPRNLIELPSSQFWNMSLKKTTGVTEHVKIQFRAEAFNVFNLVNYRTVQTNFSSSNFGQLTETEDPRVLQFGLKVLF